MSYTGLDLWIWPKICQSRRASGYMKDTSTQEEGWHTTSEPIVRLEKTGYICMSFWWTDNKTLLTLKTHAKFELMGFHFNDPFTNFRGIVIDPPSRTRTKPSCGPNSDASFLWHVSCDFPCHQMLAHKLSFNSQCQSVSVGQLWCLTQGQWYIQAVVWSDEGTVQTLQIDLVSLETTVSFGADGARSKNLSFPLSFTPSRHYSALVTKGFDLGLLTSSPGNEYAMV